MLKRMIDIHLQNWKNNPYKKPLLLRGARQVGKTYAVRKLGQSFDNIVEINFELAKDAKAIFEKNLDPHRILQELSLFTHNHIVPGKTLLFFDEIQEIPDAILSLRYFYEQMPSLHVIAAGSLFDFALEKVGLPVGRVSSMYIYPLSFMEYLSAIGESGIIKALLTQKEGFSEPVHTKLLNFVGEYLAIGGMPEAVDKWKELKNLKESFQVHHNLISSYKQDFEKYAQKHQMPFVELLFKQIPYFIGEQFQYKNIPGEYRKRELAPCLDLLCKANVIHQVYHTASHGIPLGAEVNLDWFKIVLLDVALCQAILGFDLSDWFSKPGLGFINKGAITEAFVGQELLAYSSPLKENKLYFWRRAEKSSSAEVDYIYEHHQKIIPIEVKSGDKVRLTSMNLFLQEHPQSSYGICFSTQNFSKLEKVEVRPLYAVVSLAHEDQITSLNYLI